ncbi:MAG: DUF2169 domain-containing protein [Deltaproteobacteria bacterium]|nr:DUF2169 domain-containing protein [Deltaproteobacteria bacterium]
MKIIKPQNLAQMFKSMQIDGQCRLSLAACACFTLDEAAPNRLLNEQDMWPVIEAALDKEEIFDFGVPKVRGEFLVYGSAFAPQPVRAIEVSVHVGGLTKTLAVFGNHYWGLVGTEKPEPFTHLAVNYANTFGGPDFPENPLGKGTLPDATGERPLPNVQDPRHLVGSPQDRPPPAGFSAYPMTWPQRLRHIGKVDDKWLLEDWPHFPKDTNWELFNAAPEDQRLPGFFTGDEKIEIVNMHPRKPLLKSTLPALRARLFVHQKEGDKEIFREVPCRAETLWLFPDREVGILLYRGAVAVADEEYEDVLHLYGQWESMREPPKSIEEYGRMFQEELSPAAAPAAAAEAPPPEPAPVAAPAKAPDIHPELAALLKETQEFEAKTAAMLKKAGLDPDAVVKQFLPVEERAAAGSLDELGMAVVAMEKQTAAFMKKFGITAADVEKIMAPKPEAPLPSADEIIAGLRKAGIHKPEIEAQFKETEKLVHESLAALDNLEKQAATKVEKSAQVPSLAPAPEPPPPPAGLALTVEEVMLRYGRGEPLGGLDLSGLDFTARKMPGADFTAAVLAGAIFTNGGLSKAIFKDAILKDADFTGADLAQANLEQADASGGRFAKARLAGAQLSGADFTGADFTDADLSGASAAGAIFEAAVMEGIRAQKISAPKALFAKVNMTDADLTGAELADGDFTGAKLTHCSFMDANAAGLRLSGATGEHTKFGYSLLNGSRADADTTLTDARFNAADLTDACWEGARLLRAQMMEATLDRADFSKCDLTGAIMILATAKETKFMKADLTNANLTGVNLFKGSLRKATLTRTDLKLSNLYGVDFYQAKMQRTNLDRANIKKTLLKLRQEP